jgi:large subunit ribosomal protein L17e
MGKKTYGFNGTLQGSALRVRATQERLHFKPAFEVGRAIKGLSPEKAIKYLEDVIAHKRAVPFRRYNEGITHHAQGHEFGCPSSRWPEKTAKMFILLLKNVLSNAGQKPDIKKDSLYIVNVQCNRAQANRYRRIHQAHGRVKSYCSPPTNIEIVVAEKAEETPSA